MRAALVLIRSLLLVGGVGFVAIAMSRSYHENSAVLCLGGGMVLGLYVALGELR